MISRPITAATVPSFTGLYIVFPIEIVLNFFSSLGVKTKVERGQRVFPVSDDADQVADALQLFAERAGVKISFGQRAVGILLNEEGGISGVQSLHQKSMRHVPADAVIVATGGD